MASTAFAPAGRGDLDQPLHGLVAGVLQLLGQALELTADERLEARRRSGRRRCGTARSGRCTRPAPAPPASPARRSWSRRAATCHLPFLERRPPALPGCGPVVTVVAHRGASVDRAEHTLAAYRRAVEVGADALECDIRLTADGVPVCVHDRRVDRTSNGHGPVSGAGVADLAELDFAVTARRARLGGRDGRGRPGRAAGHGRGRPGAHPGRAARVRPRLRPAGGAGDRDQAPDPLRRPGRAAAGRGAGPLRLGAPAAGRLGARPGDELLLAVAAPDAGAGAEHPDGAAAGAGAAAAAGRVAAGARPDRRAQDRRGAGPPAVRRAGAPQRRRGARVDGGRPRRRRPVPARWASTRSSPTARPRCSRRCRAGHVTRTDGVAPPRRRASGR